MTALELAEGQRRRDRAHHEERLRWLSALMPLYADGTPVAKVDVINWTKQSEAILADPTGMLGLNTGPTEDEA